ncbi:MAG: alanine racemase [Polyangiaceae bacterium]
MREEQETGIELRESQGQIRVMKMKRAAPADAVRPTRAEIDLGALRKNVAVLKRAAGNAQVWAVLKADGYGHGAPAVARTLDRAGVDGFCVALLEEAIELREAGIGKPLLVMGGYYGRAFEEVLHRKLTPVIYDRAHLEGFAQLVRARGLEHPISVHLKIDTGMARLGVRLPQIAAFAEQIEKTPEVRVTGLMTHLAAADAESTESLDHQAARFEEATRVLAERGIKPSVRHAANSAALLRQAARFDIVRPGVAAFGISPFAHGAVAPEGSRDLTMAMRVRTEIIDLRTIDAGEAVGYGSTWRAKRPTRVATVPMGYADGLSRSLSNRGHALVRGKRAPYIGAISMDLAMLDVTDHEGAALRDEVVVLGSQDGPLGKDFLSAQEHADHGGTIAWEVLTHISRRVPRFYREP